MELNAEQVKKALECCFVVCYCNTCPYYKVGEHTQVCTRKMAKDALTLINSQEQRIGAQDITISELRKSLEKSAHDAKRYERKVTELTEDNKKIGIENFDLVCELSRIKADTVREMQERLIEELYKVAHCRHGDEYNMKSPEVFGIIDQIVKEMSEGENKPRKIATNDQHYNCDFHINTPEMLRQRVADIKRDMQKGLNAQNLRDFIINRPLFALYGEKITGNLYVADELIKEINKGETNPNDENSIDNQKEEGR